MATTEKRNLALKSIGIGDIKSDGGAATTFEALGVTYKDTAEIVQEDGEKVEHFCEEQDDAIEVLYGKGTTTIKWAIVDFSAATLVKVFGGSITGTAPNEKWEAPSQAPLIEKSVQVMPKFGRAFTFARCSITAKINYKLAKTGIAQVEITAGVMQPTKAGEAPFVVG